MEEVPSLAVNEIGSYTGTVPMLAGPSVIVVESDANWSVTHPIVTTIGTQPPRSAAISLAQTRRSRPVLHTAPDEYGGLICPQFWADLGETLFQLDVAQHRFVHKPHSSEKRSG